MDGNQTEVSIRFKNYVNGEKKLEKYAETLAKIRSVTSGIDNGMIKNVKESATSTEKINKDVKDMSKYIKLAFNYTTIREFSRALNRVFTTMSNLATKSSDYLENINLFQVAFDNTYRNAEQFVNKLNEMYGLDESWLIRTVGIFKQLSNAMNLSTEQGTKLSTLLTQMSIDISSLYNIDIERASSTLQSALAGQTKPIRGATGADITQNTLQQTLNELDIDRNITQLTYAEKRLVTIVSLTRQLAEATNDFGRTIESPANQMRILSEQWERLSRAMGNLFMPILAKILPYLNAIFMVLTEIINTVATLLGFNAGDYDYFSGIADSVLDLEDGLDGASESAKKLKQGLRGFDKLNVITTPTSGSTGLATGGTGSVDPKIWEAFNDAFDKYNSKLENVQMKATKIRDAIMEWLGFTKQIDPLTGDISFKYNGIKITLKNMWAWFNKLSPEAKVLAGYIGYLVTKNTINLVSKFVKLLGATGMFKTVKALLSPLKSLYKTFDNINYSLISMSESLEIGMYEWSKNLTLMDRLKVSLVGAGGLYYSLKLIKSGMEDLAEQGNLTTESMLKVGGGILGAIGSGALIGSQFGMYGAIIGGVAGAVISLYNAFMEYPTATSIAVDSINKTTDATKKYLDTLDEQRQVIEEQLNANLIQTGVHERLVEELEKITDANGKVKKGYEDRANFILNELSQAYGIEYKITDGIIENYKEYIDKIKDLIVAKQAEYFLEANRQNYLNAVQEEAKLYDAMVTQQKNLTKAKEQQTKAQEKYNKQLEFYNKIVSGELGVFSTSYVKEQELLLKKLKKGLDETNESVKNAQEISEKATNDYKKNILTQQQYSELQIGFMTGNLEKIEEAVENYTNSYFENGKLVVKSQEEINERLAYNWGILLKEYKATSDERYNILVDELANETKAVEEITPEQAIKWKSLAEADQDAFLGEFGKLPENLQQQVIDKMQEKGFQLSNELQNGINQLNPKIEVDAKLKETNQKIYIDADTSKAQSKTQSFWDKLKFNFSQIFGSFFPTLKFADGGLPPVGQLFVANEKGAELVGHIGGQSFVANQNQMMELLDRKLGQAGNTGTQVFNIYLDENHKLGTYTLDQLKDMAKSNGKPIVIK